RRAGARKGPRRRGWRGPVEGVGFRGGPGTPWRDRRGSWVALGIPEGDRRRQGAAWLPEVAGHGGRQLAVGGVTAELPDERAAEALVLDVVHLPRDRRRGIVAPPVVAAVGVRRAGDGPGGRAARLEHLVVLDALLVGARCRAGGGAAGRALGDPGPAAAVEADAEQELVRGDALALQLLDGRVRVEAGRGDPAVGGERRVRGGRPGRRPGAEVVVRH